MTEIKTSAGVTAALSTLRASAQAVATPKGAEGIDFPDNDMPCMEKYEASIARIGSLSASYQELLSQDISTCTAAVERIHEADRRAAARLAR